LIVAELNGDLSKPLWQRNIPLGGQHWTKQLAKELKLTFAKAEHLKRNLADAEKPQEIFPLMNPVTMDMLLEIQRSLGFFLNSNPKMNIDRVLFVGPAITPGVFGHLKLVESHPTGNSQASPSSGQGYQGKIDNVEMWKPLFCHLNLILTPLSRS